MRSLVQLLLATLLSLTFASADQVSNSSVIALNEDTFKAFVLSTKHAFIAYTSEKDDDSNPDIAPLYASAANNARLHGVDFRFAEVDCDQAHNAMMCIDYAEASLLIIRMYEGFRGYYGEYNTHEVIMEKLLELNGGPDLISGDVQQLPSEPSLGMDPEKAYSVRELEEGWIKSNLTGLSYDSFFDYLRNNSRAFVAFIDEWHEDIRPSSAKRFSPAAADYLSANDPTASFCIFACQGGITEICQRQNVNLFPTLHEYRDKAIHPYKTFEGDDAVRSAIFDLTNGTVAPPDPPVPGKAYPNASASNAVYLGEDGFSASVKIHLSTAPNPTWQTEHASLTSANLVFTAGGDHRYLSLNYAPLVLTMSSSDPPGWVTPADPRPMQVREDDDIIWLGREDLCNSNVCQRLAIDYELDLSRSEEEGADPSMFKLRLNLLGAGVAWIEDDRRMTGVLLGDPMQKIVELDLKDYNALDSSRPFHNWSITAVNLVDRPSDYFPPNPRAARSCSISMLSWRCADLEEPPWYRQVWRFQWDEYGRIGSLQREVARDWDVLLRPIVLFVLCPAWCLLILWKLGRCVLRRLTFRRINLDKPLPLLPFKLEPVAGAKTKR